MTDDVRVGISADPSQTLGAMDQIGRKAEETARKVSSVGQGGQQSVAPPSLGGASAARTNVDLTRQTGLLARVEQAHKNIAREADRTAAAMERAARAAREVMQAGGRAGAPNQATQAGGAPAASTPGTPPAVQAPPLGAQQREQRQVRIETEGIARASEAATKATREWLTLTRNRPKATEYEAEAMHAAFRTRQQHNTYMRGFDDISAWEKGVRDRFSDPATADGHIQDELKRMKAMAFGGNLGGSAWGERAKKYAGALGGFTAGMITGGGGTFGTIGGGLGGLLGMIPGAGMLLGPLAGAVGGALGGQIDRGMGEATGEAVDTSRLRSALGDSSASFDDLNENVRAAADGMGVAYSESVKLARQFSETANLSGRQGANALYGELRNAIGFSRGFGLAPEQGTQFFGGMRHAGIAIDEKSGKRLGLDVAEAIGRGGNFAKAGEVLQSLSSFTHQALQMSLGRPNVEGFAWMQAMGTRHKIPGLDVEGAGGILSAADQSIRHGGSFGEASQFMIGQALAKQLPGGSIFDVQALQQGGLFATAAGRFGKDSILYKSALAAGDTGEANRLLGLAEKGGTTEAGVAAWQELRKNSLNRSHFLAAGANMLGLGSQDRAAALDMMFGEPGGRGGMRTRLEGKLGIDLGKMDPNAAANLSEIYLGNRDTLNTYADRAREGKGMKGLTAKERERIDGAKNDEELRDALMQIYAVNGRQVTKGEEALNVQTDLRNKFAQFSADLIPLTTSVKEGVLEMVKIIAPDSALAKKMKQQELLDTYRPGAEAEAASHKSALAKADANLAELEKRYEGKPKDKGYEAAKKELQRQRQKALDDHERAVTVNPWAAEQRREERRKKRGEAGIPQSGESSVSAPSLGSAATKPRVAAPGSKTDNFYAEQYPHALAAAKEAGTKNPEQAAQNAVRMAALETGSGKHVIPGTNNMGNVKAGSSWRGSTVKAKDNATGSNDPYRVYDSPKESYADMFARPRYRDLWSLPFGEFDHSIAERGYAEDGEYESKLRSMPIPSAAQDPTKVPIPDKGKAAKNEKVALASQRFEHVITVQDQGGKQIADPVVKTSWSNSPVPSGAMA